MVYAHLAGDVQPALRGGRDPRKGQEETPGAEHSAPELCVIAHTGADTPRCEKNVVRVPPPYHGG
eukprot:6976701-Prymnesium_polylepis.1